MKIKRFNTIGLPSQVRTAIENLETEMLLGFTTKKEFKKAIKPLLEGYKKWRDPMLGKMWVKQPRKITRWITIVD